MSKPNCLGIIPARGGSKRLANKNILTFANKPLIYWTFLAAQQSEGITEVVVSTDSPNIASVCASLSINCPFIRPKDLATDAATSEAVVLHALERMPGYDYVALLQPTSPLRTAEDIDGSLRLMFDRKSLSCVSVAKTNKPKFQAYSMSPTNHLFPVSDSFSERNPGKRMFFTPNGALYLASTEAVKSSGSLYTDDIIGYEMPLERSVDIDTIEEFKLAEKQFLKFNPPKQ